MSQMINSFKQNRQFGLAGVNTFIRCLHRQDSYIHPNPLVQPIKASRKFKAKTANPKFRIERAKKVIKIDLPDFSKKDKDMTPEEVRAKMKKLGIQPHRPWNEKPMFISSTGGSLDSYVPPEGDYKASIASKEGAKQKVEFVGKKGKSALALRKIRQYDEDFELKDFAEEALQIYIDTHKALTKFDEDALHQLVTERAYLMVTRDAKRKTIRWDYHGSLEPPKAVQVRQTEMLTKDNIFAQVTVRFHTQQTLAVYDRFGRLIHGSETRVKDVLEYVVFEKHLSNLYGKWRIHEKIIPPWMNLEPTSHYTFRCPPSAQGDDEEAGPTTGGATDEGTSDAVDAEGHQLAVS